MKNEEASSIVEDKTNDSINKDKPDNASHKITT